MVTDAELVEGFRGRTLPADSFHHREHVRAAWLYVREHGLLGALAQFPADLRAFAAHHGKPTIYHETITWAYLMLIHERRVARPADEPFAAFADANPDLLDWKEPVVRRYYSRARLESDLARRTFLFPDRPRSVVPGEADQDVSAAS